MGLMPEVKHERPEAATGPSDAVSPFGTSSPAHSAGGNVAHHGAYRSYAFNGKEADMMDWLYKWAFRRFQRKLQGHMDADFSPEISRALDGIDAVLEFLES